MKRRASSSRGCGRRRSGVPHARHAGPGAPRRHHLDRRPVDGGPARPERAQPPHGAGAHHSGDLARTLPGRRLSDDGSADRLAGLHRRRSLRRSRRDAELRERGFLLGLRVEGPAGARHRRPWHPPPVHRPGRGAPVAATRGAEAGRGLAGDTTRAHCGRHRARGQDPRRRPGGAGSGGADPTGRCPGPVRRARPRSEPWLAVPAPGHGRDRRRCARCRRGPARQPRRALTVAAGRVQRGGADGSGHPLRRRTLARSRQGRGGRRSGLPPRCRVVGRRSRPAERDPERGDRAAAHPRPAAVDRAGRRSAPRSPPSSASIHDREGECHLSTALSPHDHGIVRGRRGARGSRATPSASGGPTVRPTAASTSGWPPSTAYG